MKANLNFGVSMYVMEGGGKKYIGKKPAEVLLQIIEDFTVIATERGFRVIELAPYCFFTGDLLLSLAIQIKELIKGFKEVTFHLPAGEINIAAFDKDFRKLAIAKTKKYCDFCLAVGIKKLIMHPGEFAAMVDAYSLLEEHVAKIAESSVFEIFDYCKERRLELIIENLHSGQPLFRKPSEFKPLVNKGLKLCLDTVHSSLSDVNPLHFLFGFGNNIAEIHLTDGDSKDLTAHLAIGEGAVNCLGILNYLQEIDFPGPVIIEVNSVEKLEKSIAFLKKNGYL